MRQNVRRCNNGKAGVEADIEAPKEILRQIKESSFSQDATKQPTCANEMTRHNLCQARPKKGDNQPDELSIPFPNSRMQCHVIFCIFGLLLSFSLFFSFEFCSMQSTVESSEVRRLLETWLTCFLSVCLFIHVFL